MKRVIAFFLWTALISITIAYSQDTIVLQPGPEGKDAIFDNIYPDQNWGNTPKFECMAWTNSGVPGANRGLIAFNLSEIPSNAVITDAKLNLYFVCLEPTYIPHTGENESYLQLVTSEWDEETVTWNNQPSITTENQVYLPRSTDPEQDYTNIEVTLLIKKLYDEPSNYHGLMLRLKYEEPYRCLLFAGGDYLDEPAIRPKLTIIYNICDPPEAQFTYAIDEKTVSFTGISPAASTWNWDFGDGYYSDLPEPWHEYDSAGYYEVCLETSNICGKDTICQLIFIDYSSINEPPGPSLVIYPNPARDAFFFKSDQPGEFSVILSDMSGKELLMQHIGLNQGLPFRISLAGIMPGIYIVKISTGIIQVQKKYVVLK